MNRTFLALAALATLALAASCSKKDSEKSGNYTCTCIIKDNTSSAVDTTKLPENGVTLSAATSACNSAQTTFTSGGQTATCTVK